MQYLNNHICLNPPPKPPPNPPPNLLFPPKPPKPPPVGLPNSSNPLKKSPLFPGPGLNLPLFGPNWPPNLKGSSKGSTGSYLEPNGRVKSGWTGSVLPVKTLLSGPTY